MCRNLVDGRVRGTILVFLTAGARRVQVDGRTLVKQIRELLAPGFLDHLSALAETQGRVTLEDLARLGMGARFDEPTLEIRLTIPPEVRRTGTITFRERNVPPGLDEALVPSSFSGYVNVRAGLDFVGRARDPADVGRQPLHVSLEGAVNAYGWVLEADVRHAEDARSPWVRGDVRVVRDDPESMLRYTLGDLAVPGIAFLRGAPMGGVMVARNFALQPYRVTEPISRYEFFLKGPSLVQVWIGNDLVRSLQLPAGRHDLRDLPLGAGISQVRLRIIDEVGHEETLTFDSISESELLQAGLQQFAYSLGFPSTDAGASRDYDRSKPTISAFHRVGVTDTLTLGGFLQADPDYVVAGFEGLWASPVGLWGFEGALSGVTDLTKRYALSLRYRNLNTAATARLHQVWSASLEVTGSRFGPAGSGPEQPYRLGLSAAFGQRLFARIHGTLSATYRLSGTGPRHGYTADLSLSRTLWKGLLVNCVLSQRGTSAGESTQRFMVNLVWALPQNHQISESFDSETLTNRLGWSYGSPGGVPGLRASAESVQGPKGAQVAGGAEYTGYRGQVRFDQSVTLPDFGLRSGLRAGTALAFAGGRFAISRPISDSFAMVARGADLKDQPVRLNPAGTSAAGYADRMGPGVLPALPSYHLSRIHFDAPDLPFGYDLGPTSFDLVPTYKSGYLFKTSAITMVFLTGTLLDPEGAPLALQAGDVVSLDNPGTEPETMFTNREGRFAVDRMKPGRYELRMFAWGQVVIPFEIPAGKVGRYEIGALRLPGTDRPPTGALPTLS